MPSSESVASFPFLPSESESHFPLSSVWKLDIVAILVFLQTVQHQISLLRSYSSLLFKSLAFRSLLASLWFGNFPRMWAVYIQILVLTFLCFPCFYGFSPKFPAAKPVLGSVLTPQAIKALAFLLRALYIGWEIYSVLFKSSHVRAHFKSTLIYLPSLVQLCLSRVASSVVPAYFFHQTL